MEYIVKCDGTMVHPSFLMTLITQDFPLEGKATKKAKKLFLLAAALPNIPAGVLLDVVDGVAGYKVEGEKFIIISGKEEEDEDGTES